MKSRAAFPARLDSTPRPARADLPRPAPRVHEADSGSARVNLVHKLRSGGISDARVLAAMGAIERHRFVDSALRTQAYEDTSLPIGLGQTISKPSVVARMLELLHQGASARLGRVLEIGTGCGYQAAVLSQVVGEVYSIERLRALHEKARDNLRHFRIPNLHLLFGDGLLGYPRGAPYSAIIAAAVSRSVPQAWVDQLAPGGRIVMPVASGPALSAPQALWVLDKTERGMQQTVLEPVRFVPLKSGLA